MQDPEELDFLGYATGVALQPLYTVVFIHDIFTIVLYARCMKPLK
jgi:hypothetical protein